MTENGKRGKVLAVCLGVIIVAIVCVSLGFHIYSTFIYKNQVNLMKYVNITYDTDKLSGQSTAALSYSWPAEYKNNSEIESYLNTVKFQLNKTVGLGNGDKVEVQAIINSDAEKKYRIKILENSYKGITVSGLAEYASFKEIPTENIKEWESEGISKLKSDYTEDEETKTSTFSLDGIYSQNDTGELKVVLLYHVNKIYISSYVKYTTKNSEYREYIVSNIIRGKDNKIESNLLVKQLDASCVTPDEMENEGYKKVS